MALSRASYSLIRAATRSLRPSSSSLLHHRLVALPFTPFSTSSANDEISRIRSVFGKASPWPCYRNEPLLPIPHEFPFIIEHLSYAIILRREDKDERIEMNVCTRTYSLTNGNPRFLMSVLLERGYWRMKAEIIVGSKTMSIRKVYMSDCRNHHLGCFAEYLDSKGINVREIISLFIFCKKLGNQHQCMT